MHLTSPSMTETTVVYLSDELESTGQEDCSRNQESNLHLQIGTIVIQTFISTWATWSCYDTWMDMDSPCLCSAFSLSCSSALTILPYHENKEFHNCSNTWSTLQYKNWEINSTKLQVDTKQIHQWATSLDCCQSAGSVNVRGMENKQKMVGRLPPYIQCRDQQ